MPDPTSRPAPAAAPLSLVYERAASLHEQGQLGPAEALYRQILSVDPDQADTLHMLGVLLIQAGRVDDGFAAIDRALAIRPRFVDAHHNRGVALLQLGRAQEALASFDNVLAIRRDIVDVHYNRGVALIELGRPDAALTAFDKTVALQPDHGQALLNRGVALMQMKRDSAALAAFDRLLALQPGYVEAHVNRGIVLGTLKRPPEALASFDRALALQPNHAPALANRAVALSGLGRFEEAAASFDKALALQPREAETHFGRASALKELGRLQEALAGFDNALALRPGYAEALINRGVVLRMLGHIEAALDSYARAIALRPTSAEAFISQGAALNELRRLDEALASYDQALALEPKNALARFNKSLVLLATGRFESGWDLYEARKAMFVGLDQYRRAAAFRQPAWTGQAPIAGKTLFVYWEQGLGDTLQFSRYASLAADRGARVILSVQPALLRLFETFDPRIEVIGGEAAPPAFDAHAALLSLPGAFSTRLDSIPHGPPYLAANPEAAAAWAERLGARRGPRVGVVWSGGHGSDQSDYWAINTRRNVPLALMATLDRPDLEFVSLQKGEPAEGELARDGAALWPALRGFGGDIADFADTAALIANLDLVISVDTSVAHLAAAMGKPVWILNRYDACWRWLIGRADSPWHPTARLFNPPARGDWNAVMRDVGEALAEWAKSG